MQLLWKDMTINLLEWDITYNEFIDWVLSNKADVYAVASVGANTPVTHYLFEKEEDFVAFKLVFRKESIYNFGFLG